MARSHGSPKIAPEFWRLVDTAEEFRDQYLRTNDLSALDQAILTWEDVLAHPNFEQVLLRSRLNILNDAGGSLLRRYWMRGEVADLNRAVTCWEQLVDQAPQSEPNLPDYLNNLGIGLRNRYARTGDVADLNAALHIFQQAVTLTSQASPSCLTNLGNVLRDRYQRFGDAADLNAAIRAFRQAIALLPEDEPNLPGCLSNLGASLQDLYQRSGDVADLDAAIHAFQQAVASTPHNSPYLAMFLGNLGSGLRDRYAHTGDLADLDAAIQAYQPALQRASQNSPHLSLFLDGIAGALHERYARTGDPSDLEAAIDGFQQAVIRTPPTSPDLPNRLANLGRGLRDRYDRTGNAADLDAAIEAFQQSVAQTPPTSPDLPNCLNNLGSGLRGRYARTGSAADLDAAIGAFQRAIALTPQGSSRLRGYSTSLGNGLLDRYARTGDMSDLDAAIHALQQAAETTGEGSPEYPSVLTSLGNGLHERYFRSGNPADLDAAIHAYEQVITLSIQGSPEWPGWLTNLGNGLHERYFRSGDPADLAAALRAYQHAVERTAPTSPSLPLFLTNLGSGLHDRYVSSGDSTHLEAALQAHQRALALTPPGSPHWPDRMNSLAIVLRDRHMLTGAPDDLQAAIRTFRQACLQSWEVSLEATLRSSQNWGNWALGRASWEEAAQGYSFGLEAIERLFRPQLLRSSKESWLREAQGLHNRAAYALARSEEPRCAVIASEQGRARLLAEALERGRVDLERLCVTGYKGLYDRYLAAAGRIAQLEGAELRKEPLPPGLDLQVARRAARTDLEAAIEAIRRVPGYADFFRAPDFATVRKHLTNSIAGHSQPIAGVYLTVTPVGSLALIVHPGGVQPLWLEFAEADLNTLLVKRNGAAIMGGYLPAQLGITPLQQTLDEALPRLGKQIMQPLAAALDEIAPPPASAADDSARLVILIPTGRLALLPLHAACYQKDGQERAFLDDFIVTYVPSARVLHHSRETLASLPNHPPSVLAVGNPLPLSPDVPSLMFARVEAEEVSTFFDGRAQLLCETEADYAAVEEGMSGATYLHFACHGQFGPDDPLTAGVILSNGKRLTLADLYAHPVLKGTRLAVLSACQTAITDFNKLPNEAVGLPAGLLQAGVPGVVGSLWPVDDLSTALLMIKFYAYHLQGDAAGGRGPMPPVQALRRAQIWLRDVTSEQLGDLFDTYRQAAPDRHRMPYALAQEKFREYILKDPDKPPFAHAYYWAAFAFSGI